MINEIENWLVGLVEDDPIPYEIKHIVFFYTDLNNCFVLKIGGFEILPDKVYQPEFFPLEAQFVFYRELLKIKNRQYFEDYAKKEIDDAFYSVYLKNQFKNRKIYFSQFGKSPQFLFNVN